MEFEGMTTAADELRRLTSQADAEKWELHFLRDLRALRLPEPLVVSPEKSAPACYQYIVPGDAFLANKPFDFPWPQWYILVEIDGGTWLKTGYGRSGGHAHPERINADNAKRNWARMLGWTVYQFTGDQVESGESGKVMELVFTKVFEN